MMKRNIFIVVAALIAASAGLPAFAASVEERLAPCVACHGEKGTSLLPEVPSLGAQPSFYLSTQLLMFRERIRINEPMNALLKGLTDAELQRLADALARLPAPPASADGADPERSAKARALIQQHRCAFCHNQDFSGEKNAPRLAGQREDYLVKALREYKNNTRRAYDPSMADVMYPLTDADILDLAHYIARLR